MIITRADLTIAGIPETTYITKTLPASTVTSVQTQPASTSIVTSTITSDFTTTVTSTEAPRTITQYSTLPASTTTVGKLTPLAIGKLLVDVKCSSRPSSDQRRHDNFARKDHSVVLHGNAARIDECCDAKHNKRLHHDRSMSSHSRSMLRLTC